MTLYRTVLGRAYRMLGAGTTVIYMMAMFGINNTLYSMALSTLPRLARRFNN